MNFTNFPILYTIYNDELLYPTEINIARGSMVENKVEDYLTPAGLVLPYNNTAPTGNLTIEYLDSKEYSWGGGRMFLLLRNDGLFEEYFYDDKKNGIIRGKVTPTIKRQVFSDDNVLGVVSPILLASKTIDEYANMLEKILGFDTCLWAVYNIKDLHQYVLGNIPLEKLKSRPIKSEFKTIWIK